MKRHILEIEILSDSDDNYTNELVDKLDTGDKVIIHAKECNLIGTIICSCET